MKKDRPIFVLHVYPRSGGTLLSQMLAGHRNVVLLSEVNPKLCAKYSIAEQMNRWHDAAISPSNFENELKRAKGWCDARGKTLVLRDFSFINFTPHALNHFAPSKNLEALDVANKVADVVPLAFVRNAFDVWISRGCPPQFSAHYLDFISAICEGKMPCFFYEKLCASPQSELRDICDFLQIKFGEKMLNVENWSAKVTGDIDMANASRGTQKRRIAALPRKQIASALQAKASVDDALKTANQLMGYSSDFFESDFEKKLPQILVDAQWQIKKWLRKFPADCY